MPTVIVPVGLNLGPSYPYASPPDPTPEYYEVRLGRESEELTADEYRVWGTAFIDGHRHSQLAVTRETLVHDVGTGKDAPSDPAGIVGQLLDRRLLVEFDPEGPLEGVFRRLSLHPLTEGLGNTPDEPDRYLVGFRAQPILKINSTVYVLWATSSLEPSLWHACVAFEQGARELRDAGEDVVEASAAEVAREVAICTPMLVGSSCAFLDPVG
jgi:hypothetical protein